MKMLEKITPNVKVLNGFLSMLVIGLIGMLIAMVVIMLLWIVGVV
jgi:hypothetical protein